MRKTVPWWAKHARSFALLEYPVLMVDERLEPVFENEAAHKIELMHIYRHMEERQFFLQENSTIFGQLRQSGVAHISIDDALEDGLDLVLTPTISGGQLLGCIVTLAKREQPPDAAYAHIISRGAAALSYRMRGGTSGILSSVSRINSYNERELGDPVLYEYTNAITQYAYQLVRTNAHIAQFNRYKLEGNALDPQWRDICRFTVDFCSTVATTIREQIAFTYLVPEDIVPAFFDAQVLSSVLLELTSNAIKFSGEKGKMHLTLQIRDDSAEFCMEDDGLGIAKDVLGCVFEAFFSHDPRTRSICGDGLGLWLCREGIQGHGGRIMLDAREGKGTRVLFAIPLADTALASGELEMRSVAAEFVRNRFSDLFVILSDVCKVPVQ